MSLLLLLGIALPAAWSDVRTRRIPNVLTLGGLAAALVWRALPGGESLESGLWAVAVTLAVAFPLFAIGALGAGDGKLMMALAAVIGIARLPTALAAVALCGGLLAVLAIVRRSFRTPGIWSLWAASLPVIGTRVRFSADPPVNAPIMLPYGVAIAAGSLLAWGCFR